MKLRKLILPALLTLGLAGGLALTDGGGLQNRVNRASAMADYTNDPEIDVGINVLANENAIADWPICTFFVNQFVSGDVSGGDYLAFRMRSNNSAGSYFDFIPNVGGNAFRVPISPAATGIKCIPAVPNGEAFDYAGARTWDLPMNFWADADVWFCIPKTTFTRKHFGSADAINWSDGLWSVYFMFYGTTFEAVDFDIGNLYTANIDANGHLVKVNQIINWADSANGGAAAVTVVENADKITISDNNANLKPAVRFIQSIDGVDACSVSACTAAYNANNAAYEALNAANQDYLYDAVMADYANGDTGHEGGKYSGWTAQAKWEQICKLAGHPLSGSAPLFFDTKEKTNVAIIAAISAGVLSLTGLFFFLRKKKLNK